MEGLAERMRTRPLLRRKYSQEIALRNSFFYLSRNSSIAWQICAVRLCVGDSHYPLLFY